MTILMKGKIEMTFLERDIKEISIDMHDEWQYDEDDDTVSVKFYGLEEYIERFFNMTREDYTSSWIDCYAIIDKKKKIVTQLEFVCVYNEPDLDERGIGIRLCPCEGALFYNRLVDTSNGGLVEFFKSLDV